MESIVQSIERFLLFLQINKLPHRELCIFSSFLLVFVFVSVFVFVFLSVIVLKDYFLFCRSMNSHRTGIGTSSNALQIMFCNVKFCATYILKVFYKVIGASSNALQSMFCNVTFCHKLLCNILKVLCNVKFFVQHIGGFLQSNELLHQSNWCIFY